MRRFCAHAASDLIFFISLSIERKMHMDNNKTKKILFLIAFGVILFVGLNHLNVVWSFLFHIGRIFLPFLVGCAVAFMLNVPVKGFEKLLSRMKKPPKERIVTLLSIFLTMLCILLVAALFFTMVVPELVRSVKNLYAMIEAKWPLWIDFLSHLDFDTSSITDWMKQIDIDKIINTATGSLGSVLSSVANLAASSISAVTNTSFALIIAFYVLADKKNLLRQCKKILSANCGEKKLSRLYYIGNITNDTYSKFLSGQCVEAVILGVLIYLSFLIFRLPYAGLIAVTTSIFALIPYIGAFASCVIGALLTLISDPSKVLLCIAVYLSVQFIENQFIYPHVVGSSVGLSPLWTLVAAIVGGNLFGLPGILFFIPLTAVLQTLLRDDTNRKLEAKEKISEKRKQNSAEERSDETLMS